MIKVIKKFTIAFAANVSCNSICEHIDHRMINNINVSVSNERDNRNDDKCDSST